jgi:6-pyruvoyltetrahydropterin/6-carboxytetrahydropterin synthase
MMNVKVSRKAHFNAAHRLFNPDWEDSRNFQVFGKCSNPYYHGHNYELIVSVTGPIDPETGFVIDLGVLRELIKREVEDYMDHKNLNEEIIEFQALIPTAENIAVVIWNKLRPHLKADLQLEIQLYETPRNFVTYNGL